MSGTSFTPEPKHRQDIAFDAYIETIEPNGEIEQIDEPEQVVATDSAGTGTGNLTETTEASETTAAARPIRARHVLLLGGLMAFAPLSSDLYLPSLPMLSRDLGINVSQAQMTLSACILGLALGQLIVGPLSDALGRRRPLLVGIAVYVLASLLCVVTPSISYLIVLRCAQGVAGAAGIVIALAAARDLYAGVPLARFLSLLMLVNGLAPIVAPVLGGQLLALVSWRGLFAALAFIGAGLFLAAAYGLPETLPPERRQPGSISATLGAIRELIGDRQFASYATVSGFVFAAAIVYISVSPFVLQNVYGLSPQFFGLIFGINAVGLVVTSQVGGRIVGRVAPQRLLAWGMVAIALAGIGLLIVVLSGIGVVGILLALFVLVASLGLITPNASTLALDNVRAAGSASALLGVMQFAPGAIVAPLIGIGGSATAIPMATAIAVFSLAAVAIFLAFGTRKPAPSAYSGEA